MIIVIVAAATFFSGCFEAQESLHLQQPVVEAILFANVFPRLPLLFLACLFLFCSALGVGDPVLDPRVGIVWGVGGRCFRGSVLQKQQLLLLMMFIHGGLCLVVAIASSFITLCVCIFVSSFFVCQAVCMFFGCMFDSKRMGLKAKDEDQAQHFFK